MGTTQTETWRILHIDDDEDDHFLVRAMLREAQSRAFSLDWAATFDEGRKKLCTSAYHVVLIDYDLGKETGISIIQEFADRGYSAPMILLTGRGSYEVDVEAMHAGATLYLTKNEINPLLLERSIRYAIERKQTEQALRERDQKLSVALDAAQLGAWTYTFADQSFELDERARRMYRAEQPVVSHTFIVENYLHPDDLLPMQAALRKAADPAGDGRYQVEYRILQPEGSEAEVCWLNAWGLTEFEGQGAARRAVRLIGASRDISWEKRAQLDLQASNAALREREVSLRKSEAKMRSVFQSLVEGVVFLNPQGEVEEVNEAVQATYGHSLQELTDPALNLSARILRPDGSPFPLEEQPGTLAMRTGQAVRDVELGVPTAGGQISWRLVNAQPVHDDQGALLGVVVSFFDITQRKQAELSLRASEAHLRASEEKFRFVAASIPYTLFFQDLDLRYVWIFNPVEPYDVQQVIGKTDADLVPQEEADRLTEIKQQVLQTGTGTKVELLLSPGGNPRWFEAVYQPTRDASGQIIGLVSYSQDITERKQAEASLRESEQRYAALFAAKTNGIAHCRVITDAQGRPVDYEILRVNEAYEQITGIKRDEIEGRRAREVFPGIENFAYDYIGNYGRVALEGGELHIEVYFETLQQWLEIFAYSPKPGEFTAIFTDVSQRKQTEHALRESEERYRLATRATNDAIWDWNLTNDIILWNKALTALFGYPEAERGGSSGRWWKARIHPEDHERIVTGITAVIENGGEVWEGEYRFRRADDTYAEVFDRGWVVRDATGRPVRMVGAMRDMTAEKEAARRLLAQSAIMRESEAHFRQLADAMPQLVWTAQPDGTVDYYNQRYRLYGGIAPVESSQWEWGPVLHPEDLQPTVDAWNQAVRSGETYQIEHRVRMADGSYRWHLSRGIPMRNSQGQLVKWYGTATDVHDYNLIQKTLRQREARMRRLFESSLIGILTRDASGKVIEANDAYMAITGYSCEDVEAGRLNVRDITPPEYHRLDEESSEQIAAKGFCRPYEKEYIRKDGARIPVLVGYSLFEGEQAEYIGFVLDLSELKQAQAELTAYAEKLKRSNEELENFAFMASHDMQEPLRKMVLFGNTLQRKLEGQLSEEAEEYLNRMQSAAQRMQAMIQALLNLSRVNTRGSEFERVDLAAIASEVLADLEARIEASGGQVIVGDLPVVDGDPMQLRQLLQNLISNALKYHQAGRPPVVQVQGELVRAGYKRQARIVVADNGIGFDEAYTEKIFQPFLRLHGRQYEGSGIGLTICRKIVERHGGTITASSRPGQGSTFVVTLPVEG